MNICIYIYMIYFAYNLEEAWHCFPSDPSISFCAQSGRQALGVPSISCAIRKAKDKLCAMNG